MNTKVSPEGGNLPGERQAAGDAAAVVTVAVDTHQQTRELVTAVLDWSNPAHSNNGRLQPCRLCGLVTFLLDDLGRPRHKTCAEQAPLEMVEAGDG